MSASRCLRAVTSKWHPTVSLNPTRYNNTLDTLRPLFEIAVAAGACTDNPAMCIGRVTVKQKRLALPE